MVKTKNGTKLVKKSVYLEKYAKDATKKATTNIPTTNDDTTNET